MQDSNLVEGEAPVPLVLSSKKSFTRSTFTGRLRILPPISPNSSITDIDGNTTIEKTTCIIKSYKYLGFLFFLLVDDFLPRRKKKRLNK
jgi:hypothetical protein